jgi:hypothetical protein
MRTWRPSCLIMLSAVQLALTRALKYSLWLARIALQGMTKHAQHFWAIHCNDSVTDKKWQPVLTLALVNYRFTRTCAHTGGSQQVAVHLHGSPLLLALVCLKHPVAAQLL